MTGAVLLLALAVTATGGATAPAAPAAPATPEDALPRKEVAPLVKSVFEKDYPFCTDPAYPLTPDELKWCALIRKDDTRCPALRTACSRGATAEVVGHRGHRSSSISLPLSPLPVRLVLWILLGVAVAFIVRLIVRQALDQRRPDREEAVEVAAPVPEDPAAAMARQVETDVQRLLERARAAAAAGDYGAATGDAYAALLRKLEGAGVVTIESHRTNGDHLRDVGRQLPGLRPRLQAVVGGVEQVQFGGDAPTEAGYRSVLSGVVGLLAERLAALLPVAVNLGLGLGLATLLTGCTARDTWERSPSGRAAVVDVLKRYGFKPRERLVSLSKIDNSVSALVLLPGASVDEASWQAIGSWAAEGGALIVAGGQRTLPAWIGVTIAADTASTSLSAPLTVPPEQRKRLPKKLTAVVPDTRQVQIAAPASKEYDEDGDEESAPPAPLLVRGKTAYAVERSFEGGGRAIVLADDLLFTNASLLAGDNATLLIELLRPGGPKLELAGELTGLVSQNPVTSVRHGRLAPAMLQLALLILLFFVYKGARFGRPIDPIAATRRAFSEHARAIGLMYGRRRAGRHALELYGNYALERMRERLNLVGGKGLLAVAEEVATRTGRPLGEVMRVLVESRPATRAATDLVRDAAIQGANAAKDLATLRDIATLLALTRSTTGGPGERIRAQRQA